MAHHSSGASLNERLESYILGATGNYPHGKLAEHDEGEIQFAVAADVRRGVVIVDFGKSVRSLGMTAEQAAELGELLIAKSFALRLHDELLEKQALVNTSARLANELADAEDRLARCRGGGTA